jgi:hypothetical protein
MPDSGHIQGEFPTAEEGNAGGVTAAFLGAAMLLRAAGDRMAQGVLLGLQRTLRSLDATACHTAHDRIMSTKLTYHRIIEARRGMSLQRGTPWKCRQVQHLFPAAGP